MELVLLALVVFSFIGQVFVLRYFFKQLSNKLLDNQNLSTPVEKTTPYTTPALKDAWDNWIKPDRPSKNLVTETEEAGIEFAEGRPLEVPEDVKFEVEGGDSQIPVGYTIKN